MAKHWIGDRLILNDPETTTTYAGHLTLPDRHVAPGTVYWRQSRRYFIRVRENGRPEPLLATGTERT